MPHAAVEDAARSRRSATSRREALLRRAPTSTRPARRAAGSRCRTIGMLVAERDGRVVGYADVRRDDERRRASRSTSAFIRRPAAPGRRALVGAPRHWARGSARRRARSGVRRRARRRVAARPVERRGYRLDPALVRMEIELPEAVGAPVWPDGIDGADVRPRARRAGRVRVHAGVLRRPLGLPARSRSSSGGRSTPSTRASTPRSGGSSRTATSSRRACLNYWHFSGDPAFGWVGTLGVRRPWRRRGLGLALLRHSFARLRARRGAHAGRARRRRREHDRRGQALRARRDAPVRRHDTYERSL